MCSLSRNNFVEGCKQRAKNNVSCLSFLTWLQLCLESSLKNKDVDFILELEHEHQFRHTDSLKLLRKTFSQSTICLTSKWQWGQLFLNTQFFKLVGRKLAEFAESGTVVIRREPRVFKPNIWPPTSRMEWRGCSFFRGRKQWMLLEGWGPEWGPARVTDMWMSCSASLFKLDLWERGQGDLWGNLSSILMFQLPVAQGTKRPQNLRFLWVLCVFLFSWRHSDKQVSPGGFQSSLVLLIFFKGWSKTLPTIATHSFHHLSVRTLCSTPLGETGVQTV